MSSAHRLRTGIRGGELHGQRDRGPGHGDRQVPASADDWVMGYW